VRSVRRFLFSPVSAEEPGGDHDLPGEHHQDQEPEDIEGDRVGDVVAGIERLGEPDHEAEDGEPKEPLHGVEEIPELGEGDFHREVLRPEI